MRGGIGGYGLSKNVRDGYEFLVRNYQEGDEVFLFGFSRGAFTARSLCGFLGAAELLSPDHIELIDEAYQHYRQKAYDRTRTTFSAKLRDLPRRRFCAKFLGVYDTVGSPETIEVGIRVAQPQAKLVITGVANPARFEWTPLYFKEIEIIGSNAFGIETFEGQRRHSMEIYLDFP